MNNPAKNKKGQISNALLGILFILFAVGGYFIYKSVMNNRIETNKGKVVQTANTAVPVENKDGKVVTTCADAGPFANLCKIACDQVAREQGIFLEKGQTDKASHDAMIAACPQTIWDAYIANSEDCGGIDDIKKARSCVKESLLLAGVTDIKKVLGTKPKDFRDLVTLTESIKADTKDMKPRVKDIQKRVKDMQPRVKHTEALTAKIAKKLGVNDALGVVPKTGKAKTTPASNAGGPATPGQAATCAAKIAAIANSGEKDACVRTYRYIHEAGLDCFQSDKEARDRIAAHSNKCEAANDKGLKKYTNIGHRSFREMSGWNGVQRAWGRDLNNGWEANAGGDIVGLAFNGFKLYQVADWASNNLLTAKQQDKWLGRDPVTGYPITGGGPQDPDGPIDGDDVCAGCAGPGNPGDTTYAGMIGNSGVPINTHIDAMTPVSGIGGTGIYGNAPVIKNGAGHSQDNTLPSNLTAEGHSAGTTKLGLSSSEGLY
uniref:Uncharacterized protein n=1 Tax=candidate division CPR3 bacterium TaxID=2268181 RepID=A0A7C4M041_UNCC3